MTERYIETKNITIKWKCHTLKDIIPEIFPPPTSNSAIGQIHLPTLCQCSRVFKISIIVAPSTYLFIYCSLQRAVIVFL